MPITDTMLDTIKLKDGRTLIGIVDFISNKQIYFFDFSKEISVDFILLAILWKGNSPDLRFSVYTTINYQNLNLPRAILIPTNHIKTSTKQFVPTKKPKQRKKVVK